MKVFTEEEIRSIRIEYVGREKSHITPNVIELANRYEVSQETIRKIAKRKVYKWVE
jgi:Mor family transcriptional regulator